MQKTTASVDVYLKSLPDSVREDMQKLDSAIVSITGSKERILWGGTFWGGTDQSIISYRHYTYQRPKGNIEWFSVGIALQKNYISVYINAVEDGEYIVRKRGHEIGKVKIGASSISFKKLSDINLDKLLELTKKALKLTSS